MRGVEPDEVGQGERTHRVCAPEFHGQVDLLGRSYVLDRHLVNVGASVGFAVCPTDGEDEGAILKNADLAMYAAKARGRGGLRVWKANGY